MRNGMRHRCRLLAQVARLAANWRVGSTARSAAGETACSREDRLLSPAWSSTHRRFVRLRRAKNWPESHRSSAPRPKHHIAIDTNGTPIAAIPTGANRNDVTQRVPLIEAIAPIGGVRERPSAPSRPRLRRPWLRPRQIPTHPARARHPHQHRAARSSAR
ncbi:transposase [Burkholderia pseudomallei]|nr:transposase [Burkholderia pseudomallei]